MRKVTFQITNELCALLGIVDSADDAAIGRAVADTAKKVGTLTTDLATEKQNSATLQAKVNTLTADQSKGAIKALLDPANESGKITNELRAQLEKDYATNPDGLKTLLENMGAYQSVVDIIEKVGNKDLSKYDGKNWDTLMDAGLIEAYKKDAPKAYRELYKETFGNYPA